MQNVADFQLDALEVMLQRPARYTQRLVETLRFESNSQCWQREIQLRLPAFAEGAVGRGQAQDFVVPLGMFSRQRFADFVVRDAAGTRLPLVTRRQHGYVLTACMVRQFLLAEDWAAVEEDDELALDLYGQLFYCLSSMLTRIPGDVEDASLRARHLMRALLIHIGQSDPERLDTADQLLEKLCSTVSLQTQYLCWVRARPGDVISLSVSYSVANTETIANVLEPPAGSAEEAGWRRWRLWFRNRRMIWYAKFGLRPMYYEAYTPAHDHVGSYYFTVTPPTACETLMMAWGDETRFSAGANGEVACGDFTCHVHNGERVVDPTASNDDTPRSIVGSSVHVFLRAEPAANAKLVAVALLSLLLAYLAQSGAFISDAGENAAQWLLLTPAAVAGYLAQQQRHHFGPITQQLRLVLWIYVALAVLFAVSVSYDALELDNRWATPDQLDDLVSLGLVFASLAVIVMYFGTGPYFRTSAERRYRRIATRVRVFGTPSLWQIFRRYPWGWKPGAPLADEVIAPGSRAAHTAPKLYSAIGRHTVDRVLVTAIVVCWTSVALLWFSGGWGTERADREIAAACSSSSATTPRPSACPRISGPGTQDAAASRPVGVAH